MTEDDESKTTTGDGTPHNVKSDWEKTSRKKKFDNVRPKAQKRVHSIVASDHNDTLRKRRPYFRS